MQFFSYLPPTLRGVLGVWKEEGVATSVYFYSSRTRPGVPLQLLSRLGRCKPRPQGHHLSHQIVEKKKKIRFLEPFPGRFPDLHFRKPPGG